MDDIKLVKKSIIYFVPVVLAHIIFTLIDKNIQRKGGSVDMRLSIIHLSIYFYFFVIPIYLMIVNVIYNVKKQIKIYYDEIRFGAFSILGANLSVLIINIISFYFVKSTDINVIAEFFIIFIPELIMFGMISFLGGYLVKKKDDDYEEEILEGLKIPEREIEFYKKNETNNKYENESNEIFEKNNYGKETEESEEKRYGELNEKVNEVKESEDDFTETEKENEFDNDDKGNVKCAETAIQDIDNWEDIKEAIDSVDADDNMEKLNEEKPEN